MCLRCGGFERSDWKGKVALPKGCVEPSCGHYVCEVVSNILLLDGSSSYVEWLSMGVVACNFDISNDSDLSAIFDLRFASPRHQPLSISYTQSHHTHHVNIKPRTKTVKSTVVITSEAQHTINHPTPKTTMHINNAHPPNNPRRLSKRKPHVLRALSRRAPRQTHEQMVRATPKPTT